MNRFFDEKDVRVYLVVIQDNDGDLSISKFNEADHVIKAVSQMKEVEVDRVFSVNSYGEVRFHEIVFNGKLKLIDK